MDRRESLKLIATGAVAVPAVVAGCNTEEKKAVVADPKFDLDRNPAEVENEKRILKMPKFFTDHEMATIAILSDIIIPKDEVSGSATDAKVPEFIEFIVKDMPHHQTPLRGGLRWLDMQCVTRFGKGFKDCDNKQQLEVVDDIAYTEIRYEENGKEVIKGQVKPGMQQGVSFFNKMRDLVATGFYTSQIGVKDIGYIGNVATRWNGVPDEVLKQYGLAYTEKELKECISFENAGAESTPNPTTSSPSSISK
ncbi:MAG TPA: gluconate 2-dehydrogenase subunit 3 family protein [Chitinophagaceae bacterium]|nr:gluconate 2-dehydrogenase subunit 3 family protein [Chitinophagaceae bacterium]